MAVKLPSPTLVADHSFFPTDMHGRLLAEGVCHPKVPDDYRPPEPALTPAETANRLRVINGVSFILPQGMGLKDGAFSDEILNGLILQFLENSASGGRKALEGRDHPFEVKIDHVVPVGDQLHLTGAVFGDVEISILRLRLRPFHIFTLSLPKDALILEKHVVLVPAHYVKLAERMAAETGGEVDELLQSDVAGAHALDSKIYSGELVVPPALVNGRPVEIFALGDDHSGHGLLPDFYSVLKAELQAGSQDISVELPGVALFAVSGTLKSGVYDLQYVIREIFRDLLYKMLMSDGFNVELELRMSMSKTDEDLPPDYNLRITVNNFADVVLN